MIEFEPGSTNVYADLDFPDANEMLRTLQSQLLGLIVEQDGP